MSDTVRAFVAIRVNSETERAIGYLIDEVRIPGDGIRWVARTNLHLTLKFLGPSVALAKIETVRLALAEVAARIAPFKLEAAGVGAFPSLDRPRALWVAFNGDALDSLAQQVEDAAVRCGFLHEPRAFTAHLTIARLRKPLGVGTRQALEPMRTRKFGTSMIGRMVLYRSTLAPGGSIYEAIATFPFSARPEPAPSMPTPC